jgi:hypothetical protein
MDTHRVGGVMVFLFTPCNDADSNDHSKDAEEDHIALHLFTAHCGVEFFHNLIV